MFIYFLFLICVRSAVIFYIHTHAFIRIVQNVFNVFTQNHSVLRFTKWFILHFFKSFFFVCFNNYTHGMISTRTYKEASFILNLDYILICFLFKYLSYIFIISYASLTSFAQSLAYTFVYVHVHIVYRYIIYDRVFRRCKWNQSPPPYYHHHTGFIHSTI